MTPIFDDGHGGLIDGVYQTAGKRSPLWDKGTLFEGVFNEEIVARIMKRLEALQKPYYHISPGSRDIPLTSRVRAANGIFKRDKGAYIFSVHANAGGGTGWEIFTSSGFTRSDLIAEVFIQHLRALPIRHRMDASGEGDKEADFYLLKRSDCPAVLLECAFMDNKKDYDLLWDEKFKQQIEDLCVNAILELYDKKL